MSKTWYGHYIENIKGEDYVLFKDYLELDKEIEDLKRKNKILKEALYLMWNKEIDINYDVLENAIDAVKNMQNPLHKYIIRNDQR